MTIQGQFLEAEHFLRLIDLLREKSQFVNGIPVERERWELYIRAKKSYLRLLHDHLKVSLFLASQYPTQKENEFITALSKSKYLITGDDNSMAIEKPNSRPTNYLKDQETEIIKVSRLILRDGSISSLETLRQRINHLQIQMTVKPELINENIQVSLESVCNTAIILKIAEANANSLVKLVKPLSEKYMSTFINYISRVIISLHLKLQIIELEMRSNCLSIDYTNFIRDINLDGGRILDDLEKTIVLGQTNLILYQQLGNAFEKLVMQYQQISSQINLVKDDIRHLSKK